MSLIYKSICIVSILLLGSWSRGIVPAAVICDLTTGIATGVGAGTCIASPAACDGSTNDNAAFNAFASWAVNTWQATHTGQIELFIPAARTCVFNQAGAVTFDGIKNLIVIGYGATWSGSFVHLASKGQFQDRAHSVRTLAANAGDTTITINPSAPTQPSDGCQTIAACAALFTVGQPALITGGDFQHGGFPTNPWLFEWVTPTNINSSTGVITISVPLKFSYKTTWPSYNQEPVPAGQPPDFGGPATLYAWNPGWDSTFEYRGLTFASSAGVQQDAVARSATFRDVKFNSGSTCLFPTMNKVFQIWTSTMTNCQMEADKIVDDMIMNNVSMAAGSISFQNSSIKRFFANALTAVTLSGTPAASTISNSSITTNMTAGATTNGRTDSISLTNTNIALLSQSGVQVGGNLYEGSGLNGSAANEGINNAVKWSMSAGGVITIPNAYILQTTGNVGWIAPGTNLCWTDAVYTCAALFQVLDVTQDAKSSTTVSISNASPAVIGLTGHGRSVGDIVSFNTSGTCALPSPLVCGTAYFVIAAGLTANAFEISATSGGVAINTTTNGTAPFGIVQGNTYVSTNAPSCAFSCWAYAGGKLFVRTHPSAKFNCSGCSGDPVIAGLNTAPVNAPLYSYFKSTVTGASNSTQPLTTVWGSFSKLTVTIANGNQYTGSLTATNTPNMNHSNSWLNTSLSAVTYVPAIINEKSAGTRTLDASGGVPASWSGGQAGDTLTNLSQALWGSEYWQNFGTDISSDPSHPMSVTIEVITTQGVVNP